MVTHKPSRKGDRKIHNGIFYILLTGAPWRDLQERYGPRTTMYSRYIRWGRREIWKGVFDMFTEEFEDSLIFSAVLSSRHIAQRLGQKRGNWYQGIDRSREDRT